MPCMNLRNKVCQISLPPSLAWVLLFPGLRYDYVIYDNACHLDQSAVRNAPYLHGVEFVIDRCHAINHKYSQYRAEDQADLAGVNSETCEQLFRCDIAMPFHLACLASDGSAAAGLDVAT